MHERSLYQLATVITMPTYPVGSSACGVAVGEVHLDGAGNVVRLAVLEAPDQATRDAMLRSMSVWRFAEINSESDSQPSLFSAKLTMYFVNLTGNPDDGFVASSFGAPNISDCLEYA